MKKIKQSVTGDKPKIIKHELKDKKLMISGNFLKQKKKKKKEKKRNIMNEELRIEQLDIRTFFEQQE